MSGEIEGQVLEAIQDGVFAVDRETRVTLWNRRMQELTGVSRDAVLGAGLFEWFPAWKQHGEHQRLATALDGTSVVSRAFPLHEPQRFEATYTPMETGAFVVVRDMSAADGALDELREVDARFRTMADTSPVLLWMSGTDGLCTFFNERWLAFTGRPMELELGNGWAEGVHPEDFQHAMDHYLAAFVAHASFRIEYRLRRADGAYRWLLDTGVPRYLPSGTFAGFIGSCIDITELKETRDELDRRVRERTAELEAFAYSVSHDLRAPLRHIDGFSQALLEDQADRLDEEGKHYLHRVRLGAQRMAALIDDMLQLSRIGRQDIEIVRCDLSHLARGVASALQARDPGRTTEIHIVDGLTVEADPRLLKIALDNLIGNAWKFTSKAEHPRIEVTARDQGGVTAFGVRDNGVGFEMAHATKLFTPFQRLHRDDEFSGTGIGLAIVHRIIDRHGGQIRAEAAVGKGAAFWFTLPSPRGTGHES